jgi:hypothetical protein
MVVLFAQTHHGMTGVARRTEQAQQGGLKAFGRGIYPRSFVGERTATAGTSGSAIAAFDAHHVHCVQVRGAQSIEARFTDGGKTFGTVADVLYWYMTHDTHKRVV